MMRSIKGLILLVLVIGLFSVAGCRLQDTNTVVTEGKSSVEIRLEYAKNLDNKPIEIVLYNESEDELFSDNDDELCDDNENEMDGKNGEYPQKIIDGKLNYKYFDLKPGKYKIMLSFKENGEKPYITTYGENTIYLEGINIDADGRLYSTNEKLTDNEIEILKYYSVVVDLILSFEGNENDSEPSTSKLNRMDGDFFREELSYNKKKKTCYYKLHFRRSLSSLDLDFNGDVGRKKDKLR